MITALVLSVFSSLIYLLWTV